jgi:hypothetical protein
VDVQFPPLGLISIELIPRAVIWQNTTFFKLFKVNLNTECPFWEDSPACVMKGCSVLDLPKDQVGNDVWWLVLRFD